MIGISKRLPVSTIFSMYTCIDKCSNMSFKISTFINKLVKITFSMVFFTECLNSCFERFRSSFVSRLPSSSTIIHRGGKSCATCQPSWRKVWGKSWYISQTFSTRAWRYPSVSTLKYITGFLSKSTWHKVFSASQVEYFNDNILVC